MSETTTKKAPYVSFRKFMELLQAFEGEALPERIVHGNMGEYSREVKSHVLQALKFFGLVDETGVPQPSFTEFYKLPAEERGGHLQKRFLESYQCPLEGLELATVRRAELLQSFQLCYESSDETTRKSVRFFAYTALALGFSLSNDLLLLAEHNRDQGEAELVMKLFKQKLPEVSTVASTKTADEVAALDGPKDRRAGTGPRLVEKEGALQDHSAGVAAGENGRARDYEMLIDLLDPEAMTENELKAGAVMLKFVRRRTEYQTAA